MPEHRGEGHCDGDSTAIRLIIGGVCLTPSSKVEITDHCMRRSRPSTVMTWTGRG